MNIYISTSDHGIHIIEAFQLLFNKYWGVTQPVTILGYAKPEFELAPNFEFISLGKDKGPRICGELLDFFSCLKAEHFVWSVDDQVMIRPLDKEIWDVLVANLDGVSRISLVGNMAKHPPEHFTTIQEHDGFNVIEQSQDDPFRLSAIWSIWRRDYLLKYLKPGMDLWQWETQDRAVNDGYRHLGTSGRYAVAPAHVYARGSLHPDSFVSWDLHRQSMFDEDRDMVRGVARMARPLWRAAWESVKQ